MHTTFGTIRSSGRITILIPAALLIRRRFRAFARHFRKFPIRMETVDHFRAAGRVGSAVRKLRSNSISIIVNARGLLKPGIGFGSLKLIVVSRRRHFNIRRGRALGTLHAGISILDLSTAPVPQALRVTIANVHRVSALTAPPRSHLPILACINTCRSTRIATTIEHRLLHNNRIFCIRGQIRSVTSITTGVRRLIPRSRINVTRNGVKRGRLSNIVQSF